MGVGGHASRRSVRQQEKLARNKIFNVEILKQYINQPGFKSFLNAKVEGLNSCLEQHRAVALDAVPFRRCAYNVRKSAPYFHINGSSMCLPTSADELCAR